jgi:hypothetical protein
VLRKEMAVGRPAHVPDAPTHASLVAAAGGPHDATVHGVDDVTGQSPEADAAAGATDDPTDGRHTLELVR